MTAAHHAHVSPRRLLGIELPGHTLSAERIRAGRQGLLARLRQNGFDWSLLGPQVAFDAKAYVRRRLYRDRDWEILLLSWLPGHQTVIHDHGGSWGAVAVLSGTLTESLFRWDGEGKPLSLRKERALDAGRVTIESLPTIHQVANRSTGPALSLHCYSPPLTVLHSFDRKTGQKHAVELDLGPSVAVGGKPGARPHAKAPTRRY